MNSHHKSKFKFNRYEYNRRYKREHCGSIGYDFCMVCGEPLPEGKRNFIKFCSRECQRKRRREKMNEYSRNYYKRNRVDCRARERKLMQKIKLEVLTHYGGNPPKCACCGESHIEFLVLDHIRAEGTKHRRKLGYGGSNFYRWLIKNNFPDGYQVLCANCNTAKWNYKEKFCPVHHPELYEN